VRALRYGDLFQWLRLEHRAPAEVLIGLPRRGSEERDVVLLPAAESTIRRRTFCFRPVQEPSILSTRLRD